jgi:hypothetical protein
MGRVRLRSWTEVHPEKGTDEAVTVHIKVRVEAAGRNYERV